MLAPRLFRDVLVKPIRGCGESARSGDTRDAAMSQTAKAQEPSMEEILASIRRIIADDDASRAQPKATEPEEAPPPAAPEDAAPDDAGLNQSDVISVGIF